MKNLSTLLPCLACFSGFAVAESPNGWSEWSSIATPPAQTVTLTVTSVEIDYKTLYNTVTNFETITNFDTVTNYATITSLNTVTDTLTETSVETVTSIGTITNYDTVTNFDTVTSYETTTNYDTVSITITAPTVTVTETAVSELTTTITETAPPVTVVSVSESITAVTITTISATTDYVSVSASCSSSLAGLVTCPSRIVNPTYTPATPLPSNYLWGCPAGTLCHPKRDGCNFEQNPPADTYFCAPEDCLPVADIPAYEAWVGAVDASNLNDTCAWLTPVDDYFNLNPLYFSLNFGIFDLYNQQTCTPSPLASTSTLSVPVPTTIVQVTTVTVAVSSPVYVTVSPSPTGWANWRTSSSGPAPSYITKRAQLVDRDEKKRALLVPSECYLPCDYANYVYQSVGKDGACVSDGDFSSALSRVYDCTSEYSASTATSVASVLAEAVLYCSSNQKRSAAQQLQDLEHGVPPALRFARG